MHLNEESDLLAEHRQLPFVEREARRIDKIQVNVDEHIAVRLEQFVVGDSQREQG